MYLLVGGWNTSSHSLITPLSASISRSAETLGVFPLFCTHPPFCRTDCVSSFDVIEISAGFLSVPNDDWLRLVDKVHSYGLKAKPELSIQFGAGGDTEAEDLESIGTSYPSKSSTWRSASSMRALTRMMIEGEGITENVKSWLSDVIQTILNELPMEKVMFKAAGPKVYNWYIRKFDVDINLFLDHSQIVQLSCLQEGIWGMADTFGKIVTYRPPMRSKE